MIVELDTSIAGACLWLQALALTNVLDCRDDDKLLRELYRRCGDRGSIVYQRESPDVWTSFAVYVSRLRPHDRIVSDCEDIACIWAAYLALKGEKGVHVCITQPTGHGMAHAYARVGGPRGTVIDKCVEYGMRAPRAGFYDDPSADTAALPVEVP